MTAPAIYRTVLGGLWIAWIVYWGVASFRAKHVQRRESRASRASHVIPLMIAALMLAGQPWAIPVFPIRVLPATLPLYWAGVLLVVAGLLFSVWARVHLGGNWSATVTVKERHELVRSGPYRYVRHPIYTGLLVAFLGTAIARGDIQGFIAVVIAFGAFWHKLRLEERFMQETFGDAYRDYRARVKALIPFVL